MLSKFFLDFSGPRNLPKMTISGARNHHRMMISGPRNRHYDSAYILGPEIFILRWFLAPEIVQKWWFLGPENFIMTKRTYIRMKIDIQASQTYLKFGEQLSKYDCMTVYRGKGGGGLEMTKTVWHNIWMIPWRLLKKKMYNVYLSFLVEAATGVFSLISVSSGIKWERLNMGLILTNFQKIKRRWFTVCRNYLALI